MCHASWEYTTSPCYCVVMGQNRQEHVTPAVCWALLISLSSFMNTACSHAAVLSLIINRFLSKDLCLDLKKLIRMCCVGQSVPSGCFTASPPFGVSGKHLSVFRGGFSTFLPSIYESADRSYFGVLVFAGALDSWTIRPFAERFG